jgi:hypothetical protein
VVDVLVNEMKYIRRKRGDRQFWPGLIASDNGLKQVQPMTAERTKDRNNGRRGTKPLPPTAKERMDAGRALRERVPRASHAEWSAPANRPDPISVMLQSDCRRLPELLPIRYGRMRQSPFAFFRGSAAVMAWDLSKTPVDSDRWQVAEREVILS